VTQLIFGRWNKIFGEQTKGKEIVISYEIDPGQKHSAQGGVTSTNEHDVYINFEIKDGTRRFPVNDRSLGFRWFFAFMLFTQFRVARNTERPILFLFDEPASNLHAAAQQRLIESFPEIAKGKHSLAYTTHSHYMIEPKWLEQTFIVTNRGDTPQADTILDAVSLDDESLDIRATPYRSFVNSHPKQISYFQPITDRLEVIPSRFDIRQSSVIVEGRSDYYILRYAAKITGKSEMQLVPGLGASTLSPLIALHLGWGLDFIFLIDSDNEGRSQKGRYIIEYGIPKHRIVLLEEIIPNAKVIEDIIDEKALSRIEKKLNLTSRPTKAQLKRFFQEMLASNQIEELSPKFKANAETALRRLTERLSEQIENTQ
jgi:predicted ATP-dependent endonuclease of OLD family